MFVFVPNNQVDIADNWGVEGPELHTYFTPHLADWKPAQGTNKL